MGRRSWCGRRVRDTTEFGGDDETDEEFHRLAFFAGDEGEEPALWAAPVVLLVVLAACAVLVASRSRDRTQVVRDLAVWCALLWSPCRG